MGESAPNGTARAEGERFTVHRRDEVEETLVRAQLDRILASEAFSHSERPGRFLRLLVEYTLRGDAAKLNEYLLAIEVFNRKPTFDPSSDPIVRVEAGRLRRRLQEYYGTLGLEDPVIIDLPQRTYIPTFEQREVPQSSLVPSIPSWIRISPVKRVAALGVLVGILAGWAMYWAADAIDRKSSGGNHGAPADVSRSIVVLPFADLSPKHDQEYFCDGLSEELIQTLARVDGLHVVARTTAFHLKGKTDDVRSIGRGLNVGLVLEGSLRKSGERLRISAELINATDGYHMWSRSYERDARDAFEVQREIAQSIVSAVRSQLSFGRGGGPAAHIPTPEAYNHYLKGLHLARDWNISSVTQAVREFEQAAAADPEYPEAHAMLGEYYALMGVHAGVPPNQVHPKARAEAEKAIQLDEPLAEGHASLGLVTALYEWDWSSAERQFRRARDLDPNDANIRAAYVMGYLVPRGRLDDAFKEIREAESIDPLSPGVQAVLGLVYYFQGRYDLAIEQLKKPLELDPDFQAANLAMGSALMQKQKLTDATAVLQEGRASWDSGVAISMLGSAFALMGKKAEAQAQIHDLMERSKNRYVSPSYMAAIYAGLGDKNHALEWLERAHQARSASLAFLKVDPCYENLRSDPRFIALLRKIQLQ